MSIHTAGELYEVVEKEASWRKHELVTFKLLVDRAREHQAEMLRRAGLALLYAHWEGFVKNVGTAYVEFVACQKVPHRDLAPNFLALAIKTKLHNAAQTTKASVFNEVAAYFVERVAECSRIAWKGSVQTKSNLSAERLREIVLTLGLDYAPFEVKEKSVVEFLRDARNGIAHGEYLSVSPADYDRLHHEVLELIDEYRNQIDAAAHTAKYKRP